MREIETTVDEYIAPDSDLASAMNYWRGWWRFFWRWNSKSVGFEITLPRRHIAPYVECGKWAWTFCCWRLTFVFSCDTHAEAEALNRKMFVADIWPTIILEDVLDAEYLNE